MLNTLQLCEISLRAISTPTPLHRLRRASNEGLLSVVPLDSPRVRTTPSAAPAHAAPRGRSDRNPSARAPSSRRSAASGTCTRSSTRRGARRHRRAPTTRRTRSLTRARNRRILAPCLRGPQFCLPSVAPRSEPPRRWPHPGCSFGAPGAIASGLKPWPAAPVGGRFSGRSSECSTIWSRARSPRAAVAARRRWPISAAGGGRHVTSSSSSVRPIPRERSRSPRTHSPTRLPRPGRASSA